MFSILIINNCQEVADFIQAGPSLEITSSIIDKQYCCLIIEIQDSRSIKMARCLYMFILSLR